MKMFGTVAIVGTGLIGGSIALAIKKKKLAHRVIGIAAHKKSLLVARKMGAIDIASLVLDVLQDADVVILAMPPSMIISQAPAVAKFIKPGCIVFDVASTKAKIVRTISPFFSNFVGTHPLAGSEKRGITNARADLIEQCVCIVTPLASTSTAALRTVKAFWGALGCRVISLRPEIHDRVLAIVSHVPHILAYALMNAVPDAFLKFGPSSLKETTRIAASDSTLWADIILENRKQVLKNLQMFEKHIRIIQAAILANDAKGLARIFEAARNKRKRLT